MVRRGGGGVIPVLFSPKMNLEHLTEMAVALSQPFGPSFVSNSEVKLLLGR